MTADPNDKTIEGRLDLVADAAEQQAGIDPGALRRDRTIPATLKRIADAIQTSDPFGTITDPDLPPRAIVFSIQDPENLKTHAGRSNQSFLAWFNYTSFDFAIARVRASADADNYQFTLFRSASFTDVSTSTDTQLVSVTCADDGTGGFTANITAFDSATVPSGTWIIFQHTSGSAESVSVSIEGSFAD